MWRRNVILLYVVELVDIVLIQDVMCGIILYFTNPDCCIHVAEGINTALTMLQHRGQGRFCLPE